MRRDQIIRINDDSIRVSGNKIKTVEYDKTKFLESFGKQMHVLSLCSERFSLNTYKAPGGYDPLICVTTVVAFESTIIPSIEVKPDVRSLIIEMGCNVDRCGGNAADITEAINSMVYGSGRGSSRTFRINTLPIGEDVFFFDDLSMNELTSHAIKRIGDVMDNPKNLITSSMMCPILSNIIEGEPEALGAENMEALTKLIAKYTDEVV